MSAMSFWEVAMLVQRRRLVLAQPVANWRHNVLELGIVEIPVSGDIGILATELEDFPLDPASRPRSCGHGHGPRSRVNNCRCEHPGMAGPIKLS